MPLHRHPSAVGGTLFGQYDADAFFDVNKLGFWFENLVCRDVDLGIGMVCGGGVLKCGIVLLILVSKDVLGWICKHQSHCFPKPK